MPTMPEAPATYIGLACAALLMAGFVPGVSDAASGQAAAVESRVAVKGDLLMPHQPAAHAEVVSSRIEGDAEKASVLMRSRVGALVYHSDAAARVTMAAKNVVLPPLPERMAAKPASPVASAAAAPTVRGKLPVGCERIVSVLVKSAERDRIGRCIS
jgi:hypothetical protein